MQIIPSAIASGLGVSLLPRSAGMLSVGDLAVLPLAGSIPLSETGLASLTARHSESLLSIFRRVAQGLTKCGTQKPDRHDQDTKTLDFVSAVLFSFALSKLLRLTTLNVATSNTLKSVFTWATANRKYAGDPQDQCRHQPGNARRAHQAQPVGIVARHVVLRKKKSTTER